jgi:hypothetical protein
MDQAVERKPRQQVPGLIPAEEMGRRFRTAMDRAGIRSQADAMRIIQKAVPGTTIGRADLCSLYRGYTMPRIDRLMTLVVILGLDMTILFREGFDGEGRPISRTSHPDLFRSGYRVHQRIEEALQGDGGEDGDGPSRN